MDIDNESATKNNFALTFDETFSLASQKIKQFRPILTYFTGCLVVDFNT